MSSSPGRVMIREPLRDLEPGTMVAEKYVVIRELGRGGMGAVYLARHQALGQEFAVKFLSGGTSETTERFFREARAAAKLQSEYVVRVSDIGDAQGIGPYMVMEHLVGIDLARMLERDGRLSIADAVDAVVEASVGLGEAHALGIVHRDVKPSNLFLTDRPGLPSVVKVLDFGISKITELDREAQRLTETRTMMGSPLYMSPEQLRSAKDVDARADVWSIGIVLHELLTGKAPFEGETVGAVFANILEVPPHPLRDSRPDAPEALADAIVRCLARDPSERFATMGELARTIVRFGSRRSSAALERSSLPNLDLTTSEPNLAFGALPSSAASSRDAARTTAPTSSRREPKRVLAVATAVGLVGAIATAAAWVLLHPRAPLEALGTSTSATSTTASSSEPTPLVTPAPTAVGAASSMPSGAASGSASAATADPAQPKPRTRGTPKLVPAVRPSASAPSEPAVDLDRRR